MGCTICMHGNTYTDTYVRIYIFDNVRSGLDQSRWRKECGVTPWETEGVGKPVWRAS